MIRNAWQLLAGAAVAVFGALLAPTTLADDTGSHLAMVAPASAPTGDIANHRCLRCHADPLEKTRVHADGTRVNLFIDTVVFDHSVHGKQPCNGCHNNVTKLPHEKPLPKSVGCIECHKKKWEAQKDSSRPAVQAPRSRRRADGRLSQLRPRPAEQERHLQDQRHLLRLPRCPQHRHPGQPATRRAPHEEPGGLRPLSRKAVG
jgi:hypothetical protein